MGLRKKIESEAQDGFPFPKWRYKNPKGYKVPHRCLTVWNDVAKLCFDGF
jgi:hypothetical protein